jgi:hypothetical protein
MAGQLNEVRPPRETSRSACMAGKTLGSGEIRFVVAANNRNEHSQSWLRRKATAGHHLVVHLAVNVRLLARWIPDGIHFKTKLLFEAPRFKKNSGLGLNPSRYTP